MNRHFAIDEIVPHAGTMSLLDDLVDYDEESLTARVRITAGTLFAEEKGVPGWVGLEYMAQAIGAFAGLKRKLEGNEPQVGFLVGSRRYTCSHAWFPPGSVLTVRIEYEFQADNGLNVCNCSIHSEDGITADAALNVFQPDDVDAFLQEELA